MKSFFGICVLSALAAVATTQPTHNSPHHNVEQTQYHTRPEHHMRQPQQHIISQPEPHNRQPHHYISQPEHDYDSWSTLEAQAQAQSQTWIPPYQPEMLSPPHHISQPQPRIIHSQPQPLDPQFELHPYPYQHPHYPPTGSHHTQDTGPIHPTHGWNPQEPAVVHQQQLPEAPAPEHYINSNKEDYPNQSSAVASAVVTSFSNSVPESNHEPAHPQRYKIISIPKADDGAVYTMPVADHETRRPKVIQTSNDEGLPDIVQEILAKYRHIPIEIKPDNNAPSKEHKSESHGPVHRPHKHKKHKVPTIPVVTKQSAKAKAVAVAKTGTDKIYTILTGGKHSTATKAPPKHKHKNSHKKVWKPLLDPELLAKELELLSKELWVPSPAMTHEKDIPCDDKPIVTDDCTNSDNADCNDGSNSPDKNKPKDKPKDKHHHKKHLDIFADTTPEKDFSNKTPKPSSYIESKKDANEDTDCDTASLDDTTEPGDDENPLKKEDKKNKHEPKPIMNEKQNIISKLVNPKIENNDFKEEKVAQKKELEIKVTKKVESKTEEEIEQSEKKKFDGKQNQKKNRNPDETLEPSDVEKAPEEENEKNKHVPKPQIDDKQNYNPEQSKPQYDPTKHHHNKHAQPHTPTIVVPEKNKTKTTMPSSNVKPGYHKDAAMDNDCDSADSDEALEPCDVEKTPEKENEKKKHEPKPQIDEKQNYNPEQNKPNNNPTKHHHNNHAQPNTPTIVVPEKNKTKTTMPTTNVKPGYHNDADKDNDCDSADSDETLELCDVEKAPEKENEKKKHVPKPQIDDKQNYNPEQNKPKNKPTKHHHNKHAQPYSPTVVVPEKNKTKTAMPSTNVKPGYHKNADKDNDCDSADSDETTKPRDTANDPEKDDKTKKHQPKPKTDDIKNTTFKPVDTTKTDHKVVQKKNAKNEEIKKGETKKKETLYQSENAKQQPEIYGEKQKPAEQDNNSPVSDECDSTESPVKQELYTKRDVKKVEQTKEVIRKVDTKKEDNQTMKNEPKPHKYQDKLKPEKQEDISSDIEDCVSTESSEPQRSLDKTLAPEHKIDLKEPLSKANQDNKASKILTKEKKIVVKKEKTLKVEKKTKKSTQNVVSSEAVDKSKPVEKSNENSELDDCDPADSEIDRKLDKTKTTKEKNSLKKNKTEEVIKKKVTARNKTEGKATGEELTSDVVAEILEKSETDQPLSTVGFLISLISHALRGDSVKEMFEEPKIKKFVKGFIAS